MYGLIVFLPLLGFLVAGLFGERIGARASELVTTTLLIAAALLSWVAFAQVGMSGEAFRVAPIGTWIQSANLDIQWALRIDTLTVVMLVVVNTVSALVHVYSIGYMHEDPARPRFFAYLSLFTFAMLMLVTSDNLVQMFFGWEGVGLASYLLIGFWYQKPSANAAAIKAFVVNRVGDFGFSLGIFLTFVLTQSVTFDAVFAAAPSWAGKGVHVFGMTVDAWTIACLLLFMGAMGKSAQFLLHTWLPDAMEGPTPVSALIHAATMVTAGVFMVARLSPLFELAPTALAFVTVIGATTAFFAATVGLVQNDIKRVIAYSTCSQLGYMFVGLGVGGYALGIFHLFTHAFFKALLFLGAGSVIHAMHHEQDMRNMGGLKDKIPKTYLMMVIGTLALTGFPMTAGYFSKDAIIEAAYAAGMVKASAVYAFALTTIAALFTAFYSWRLIFMTFHGAPRWAGQGHDAHAAHTDAHGHDDHHAAVHAAHEDHAHDDHAHHGPLDPHESPAVMLWPLMILTAGALLAGVAFRHVFIGTSFAEFWRTALPDTKIMHDMHNIPTWVAWVPFIMMSAGTLGAIYAYLVRTDLPARVAAANPGLYKFLLNKWYFDELYDLIFVRPAFWLGRLFWATDRNVIDRFGPDGLSSGVAALTARAVRLQTGYVYHYAFAMLIGVAGFLTWYLLGGAR
jgi:NADH-quinone oxidoreductase subunit L